MMRPVFLIVGSVCLLSGADAIIKAFSVEYSIWQFYVARSLFSVPIICALMMVGRPRRWTEIIDPWVMLRSALLVGMWIAYYAALPLMDLSAAATALYTAPLFIAAFSSFIEEPVRLRSWLGILLGFVGVLLILRPGTDEFSVWTALPLLGAILYALAAIVTRKQCQAQNALTLALALHLSLFLTGLIGSAFVLIVQPLSSNSFLWGHWSIMGASDWAFMAALGAILAMVAVGVARAYQCGQPSVVGMFDYAYLVFASGWGVLFFSETPDTVAVAGTALIVCAGVLVILPARSLLS